jgi:hypothetical protein
MTRLLIRKSFVVAPFLPFSETSNYCIRSHFSWCRTYRARCAGAFDAFVRNEQLFHIESNIPHIMAFVGHRLEQDDQIILYAGNLFAIMSDLYPHGFHDVS